MFVWTCATSLLLLSLVTAKCETEQQHQENHHHNHHHHVRRNLAKKKVTFLNNCENDAVAFVVKDDPFFWTPVDYYVLCGGESAEYFYDGDYVYWFAAKSGPYGDDDTMQSCMGSLYSPFCALNPQSLQDNTVTLTFCSNEPVVSTTDGVDDEDEEEISQPPPNPPPNEPKSFNNDHDDDDEEEDLLPPDRIGD
jgi:hypothetical protein